MVAAVDIPSADTTASEAPPGPEPRELRGPTIWGLGPVELHDYYWAARGVHVVRQGGAAELEADAELFLLARPRTLVLFRMRALVETLSWVKPEVTYVRLRGSRGRGYRERVLADSDSRFLGFKRVYDASEPRSACVVLTRSAEVARAWRDAADLRQARRRLRQRTRNARREIASAAGRMYDGSNEVEAAEYVRDLVHFWARPATSIPGVKRVSPGVWAHEDASVDPRSRFIGPAWVGAGRRTDDSADVLGPAVLWDDPDARPARNDVEWGGIEPSEWQMRVVRRVRQAYSPRAAAKRVVDVVLAVIFLLMTLPLYPFVILAIWLEDGRPFFFGHPRETIGGRQFRCIKFRSMRKDADQVKAQLAAANQADGPQFFMERDPRLTRVGRIIRKTNIDELPQFLNVLAGDMSIVGPRPSPYAENQFCPAWREARLSVRPGVTGLWQVKRTRRKGCDFQEWIKFDLEYVDRGDWRMDLSIMVRTVWILLRGLVRST